MSRLTRRDFVRRAALVAAASPLLETLRAATPADSAGAPAPAAAPGDGGVRWLEGRPERLPGATWGHPWPRGEVAAGTAFALRTADGTPVPVQSWPLATWPDGSLKWTAHAIPAEAPRADRYELAPGVPAAPDRPVHVAESADAIVIDTGVIRAEIARSGPQLLRRIERGGRDVLRGGRLVCRRQDRPEAAGAVVQEFAGEIDAVTLEQAGPVRAVVKIEGRHVRPGRRWLPFVVRLYFHAGGEQVRILHTILYDGVAAEDFITALGIQFTVPLAGELHDRHVRFAGRRPGQFAEAVRGLTGLRRDPGAAVRRAQLEGRATPPAGEWRPGVADKLQYVPAYADWTLVQPTCDGFEIRKRTHEGCTWLSAARGRRAGGLGYVGTPSGGVAFGLRNFWQGFPAQLDVRGATGAAAEVAVWMWAPDAAAMDLRPYHDGLGMDTFDKQYNGGLEITYEDYEPGFNSPEGVGRTSEVHLWCLPATPARADFAAMLGVLDAPPQPAVAPAHLHRCGVFGGLWSPADRSTPARAAIEDRLDALFDYYAGQRDQRRWYGFWNYGDVMHTYDTDRREWRYDVGGFAWDNSELSTDIWLWLHYVRSGRADVFRFAEAMTRHTGEVDVHHLGRFAPLGSRHNVQHWGCSAKQLRIATAANRRYYYYLTGDERVGDLMREQLEAGQALVRLPPGRKLPFARNQGDQSRGTPTAPDSVGASVGTDWGSLAAAWLTEWERTGDARMRERLVAGMRTLGAQPRGLFSTGLVLNVRTGAFEIAPTDKVSVSHLNAVFGLVEVCAELNQLLDVPEFRRAWLDYCELYNAGAEEQARRLGAPLRGTNLRQGHARLTAYAARVQGDATLARRAWAEFFGDEPRERAGAKLPVVRVEGTDVLQPVDEVPWVSTNGTAQWGLAAIQCLALAGDALPEDPR